MERRLWGERPYYSLDYYFKSVYGTKLYKIAIDGGMTCPTRDGSIDTDGCIFCSAGGSGEFAASVCVKDEPDIHRQIDLGIEQIREKSPYGPYIAYFQPFTNTYAPVSCLRKIYTAALSHPGIAGLSIATRPDCLGEDVLALLEELRECYPSQFIWVELGLQTIHRETIQYIRRGYENSVFEKAIHDLYSIRIPSIVHVILGLPGETKEQMLTTIEYLNTFPIFGIKLQLLHVLSGTDLAIDFAQRKFDILTLEEYTEILLACVNSLSPETVIHRLTGDGPKDLLIAPTWSLNKKAVLNHIHKEMRERNVWQGKKYTAGDTVPPIL